MPQYRLRAERRADRLEVAAAADGNQAKDANERANNYMLAVVLLAAALFFAGLSTKLEGETAQRVPRPRLGGLPGCRDLDGDPCRWSSRPSSPDENRTRATRVKVSRANHYTTGPRA